MDYKRLVSLREARVKRLVDEAKQTEKDMAEAQRQNIRDSILQK